MRLDQLPGHRPPQIATAPLQTTYDELTAGRDAEVHDELQDVETDHDDEMVALFDSAVDDALAAERDGADVDAWDSLSPSVDNGPDHGPGF